jgi:hypothetical protein
LSTLLPRYSRLILPLLFVVLCLTYVIAVVSHVEDDEITGVQEKELKEVVIRF